MKKVFSRLRRRLDVTPLWVVGLANLGILGLWLVNFRIPDPIPYLDDLFVGAMFALTSLYVWNRFFGPPSALAANARKRRAEIELLSDEIRSITSASQVGDEIARLDELLPRVAQIQERIEQSEVVLAGPGYSEDTASSEVRRLQKAVGAAIGSARENLEKALEEANRHAGNIGGIRARRDELVSALERIFQIFRRIHSQVVALGLAQGAKSEVTGSIDELARTLDEFESERRRMAEAEKVVERELEEASRKAKAVPGAQTR